MQKNSILKQKQMSVLEKRKHLIITTLCNNNCLFCLASDMKKEGHRDMNWIKQEMKKGLDEGFTRLILSGGDPTMHPLFPEIIKTAKDIGYKHVQAISNGRMFASEEFLRKCIQAGLDEVTVSVHGHNSELHDYLTSVPGSFVQTIKGIKNALSSGIITSCDIVLNKKNYASFPKIVKFLYYLGVREIDVLHIVPFGNAYKNKEEMLYKLDDAVNYIHEGLKFAKDNGIIIWTNRLPAKYLKGFEDLIQDSAKIIDEIYGRKEGFEAALAKGLKPSCYGERCNYCNLQDFCDELFLVDSWVKTYNPAEEMKKAGKTKKKENEEIQIILEKSNLKSIERKISNSKGEIRIVLPRPGNNLIEYKKNAIRICEAIPKVKSILRAYGKSAKFVDVPACLCGNRYIGHITKKKAPDYLKQDGSIDVLKFAQNYSLRNKVKSILCKDCMYNNGCKGIFQKYVQTYGFDELKPVATDMLIRINLSCNQNCLFCNTNERSEEISLDKKDVIERIKSMAAKSIVFSGKEPTLNSNLEEYIRTAADLAYSQVEIQTNAIRCADLSYSKKLKDAGLTNAFISLHSHIPEISDKITQAPGTWKKTIEGIKNLNSLGVKIDVNIVINSLNYKNLKQTVEFISKELKVDRITFSFVAPINKALENKHIIPKISEVLPNLRNAIKCCEENNITFTVPLRCGIPFCMLEGYDSHVDPGSRDTRDKMFFEKCKKCKFYQICPGVWTDYVNLYGSGEFEEKNGKDKAKKGKKEE